MIAKVEYLPELPSGLNCRILINRNGKRKEERNANRIFTTYRFELRELSIFDLYDNKPVILWTREDFKYLIQFERYITYLNKDHHLYMLEIAAWINGK